MFDNFFGYEAKRKRLLKKAPEGPIKDFLSIPFPSPKTPIDETPILAVDFETTGLKPNKDEILSIGFISIEFNEILLSSAYHQVICTNGKLDEENVVIHHITDDVKSQGEPLHVVVEKLLKDLAGKVMLVHFAYIEKHFLEQACKKLYGMAPIFPIIDTLVIAKRRLERYSGSFSPAALRLFNLRFQHQLPQYKAHNALSDALATAELFLAEIEIKCLSKSPPLKALL
ncbi:MAG: exonuclease domain-containing protein [Pseudomonadota bacterium]